MKNFLLRNNYVFGPVKSRRLGISLGMNILSDVRKICNFNCVYCECGWNEKNENENANENISANKFPQRNEIAKQLENFLISISKENQKIDSITFSGNGEPTLHPQFLEIIEDTILLRNAFLKNTNITVLSNATKLNEKNVFEALNKIENPILKIDSAKISTVEKINLPFIKNTFYENENPIKKINIEKIVEGMKQFNGNFIMQIMFLRGENNGIFFDNTTNEELEKLINIMQMTNPRQIMIYSIDRKTPAQNLVKLEKFEMENIAKKIEFSGFNVMYV